MVFEGRVRLGFTCAQLDDSLLSFLKGLYLCEKLTVDLHYCLSLSLGGIVMDGGQFPLAGSLGPPFT